MERYQRPEQGNLTSTNDSSDSFRQEAFQMPLAARTNDSRFASADSEMQTFRPRPHASQNFGLLSHTDLKTGKLDSTPKLPLWARMQPEPSAFNFHEKPRKAEADATGDQVGFPARKANLMGGSEFFEKVLHVSPNDSSKNKGLQGAERERAILEQVRLGNVPDSMRQPKTITVKDANGNEAQLKVLPDYFAIGSNEDNVRVPMTPILAKAIAEKYGMALPTKKLVKDIYQQADLQVAGVGLVQSKEDTKYMDGNGYYLRHNRIINSQIGSHSDDTLIAGHKKDIIISKYAANHSDRLDFYGMFDRKGKAIQGSGGGPHENTYVDYSHGARFISQDVIVNGKPMRYDDVLRNPEYAGLLSDEGAYDPTMIYKKPNNSSYDQLMA